MNGKIYNLKSFIVGIIIISSIGVFSVINVNLVESAKTITPIKKVNKTKTILTKNKKVVQINQNFPVNFKIPALKIDTNVISVGLTLDGAMDSPVGPMPAGWFNLGTIPGEIGSAVIDGHSGWKNGIPAVFDKLYKLKIGDKIYVTNGKGIVNTFIVSKVELYLPNDDASSIFISSDGKSHLNLITCTGVWDVVAKSHSNRLVVFSDKEIK